MVPARAREFVPPRHPAVTQALAPPVVRVGRILHGDPSSFRSAPAHLESAVSKPRHVLGSAARTAIGTLATLRSTARRFWSADRATADEVDAARSCSRSKRVSTASSRVRPDAGEEHHHVELARQKCFSKGKSTRVRSSAALRASTAPPSGGPPAPHQRAHFVRAATLEAANSQHIPRLISHVSIIETGGAGHWRRTIAPWTTAACKSG